MGFRGQGSFGSLPEFGVMGMYWDNGKMETTD